MMKVSLWRWLIIVLVALAALTVAWPFVSRKIALKMDDIFEKNIKDGKYDEAMQLSRKIRWVDKRIGAYAFSEAAELKSLSLQGKEKKALLDEAVSMMEDTDFGSWNNLQKYYLYLHQASLNAMAGDQINARSYAEKSQELSLNKKSFGKFLDESLMPKFNWRSSGRSASLEAYEQVKLNEMMEESDKEDLKLFEVLSLIEIDVGQARRLRDDFIRSDQFTDKMHASYCDDAKYIADAKEDAEYCADFWRKK